MNTISRSSYLDNLKIFLTLLVIFHHAGQAYGNGGDWGYHPSNVDEYMPMIWHFFSVNASFFMGLFFLISGYFIPRSFDKQGSKTFIWKKFLRLGVPTLIMGAILSPLVGKAEIAHTWYLEQLFFYSLIYVLVKVLCKHTIGKPKKIQPTLITLLVIAVILSTFEFFVRRISPQDSWMWMFGFFRCEPAHLPQYIIMFIIGIVAYRQNWLEQISTKVGLTSLLIGIVMACAIYLCGYSNDVQNFIYSNFAIYESFLCISISFGLLWLFRKTCNFSNRFLNWAAGQSYGAYFFHLPLMLIIQNMTDSLTIGGVVGKFLFIGIVTTIVSYGLTSAVRLIPGVKKVL